MIKILFPLQGFVAWNGGVDLCRMIAASFQQSCVNGRVEVIFSLPNQTRVSRIGSIASHILHVVQGGKGSVKKAWISGDAKFKAALEIVGGQHVVICEDGAKGICKAAESVQADVIFPTLYALKELGIKKIGYIYDFQHKHLPDLFPKRIRRRRDRRFQNIVSKSDAIVVNSESVARDAIKYLNVNNERILILPFTPYIQKCWLDLNPSAARQRYRISKPYLMICNQFWRHKDHGTALRAFALLQKRYDLTLVLTGEGVDHRNPGYYESMVKLGKSLGVASRVLYLGAIPKVDQVALVRGARALLQPTLFEGGPGGGSVYEAIGLGVPVVVSNIEVNREIDVGDVRFFEVGNPYDLAQKIAEVLSDFDSRLESTILLQASEQNLCRLAGRIVNFLETEIGKQQPVRDRSVSEKIDELSRG